MKKLYTLVAAFIIAACLFVSITPVQAGGPIVWRPNGWWVPMQYGPTNAGYVQSWLKPSSRFKMICWTDYKGYTGNYYSVRWFWGQSYYNGSYGYVHSSYVYYQTAVPHCK